MSSECPVVDTVILPLLLTECHPQERKEKEKEGGKETRTHVKDTVKWNLCLRPLKVMKDCPGKLRVVISQ